MKHRRVALVSGILIVIAASSLAVAGWPTSQSEGWPEVSVPDTAAAKVEQQIERWANHPKRFRRSFAEHSATGAYLNRASACKPKPKHDVDDDGLLLFKTDDEAHYHPVLLAQCGLKAHALWLDSNEDEHLELAVQYADKLIEIQREDGAFPYNFSRPLYFTDHVREPGWTSAMAQGQALSLLVRLYDATGDERFIEAGRPALDYLLTHKEDGGVMTDMSDLHPSLDEYVFFEEHVSEPKDNYTLNGYMFALLGLYDWSQLPETIDANQKEAGHYFKEGIRTLEKVLPYYEMGGMTAYDLTHITFDNTENLFVTASYTGTHVYLLYALHSLTGNETLDEYQRKWAADLDAAKAAPSN